MVKLGQNSLIVVDLTDKIWIYTQIPAENHAALRSGFAGYPANPRWNATKYRAWKQGYQWRRELSLGKLTVRESDSQLVPILIA
ncbi:MAG: hypothetical protein EA365_06865 [Gloeocapsa sp. DLM2.Bin57]|nr:MAG: hypothetical protein EA365_06865 [Gloeocapsa sp. DLM2.Bin57]